MIYVYILQSEDGQHFYAGVTEDPKSRFEKHSAGDVSHTRKHRPWRLNTYIAFTVAERASEFERYLKTGSGRALARKHL